MKIQFNVLGTPAPKGSGRAIVRGGKAYVVPASTNAGQKKLGSWSAAVKAAAREAVGTVKTPTFVLTPLVVTIVFRMPRPKDHFAAKGGLKPWAELERPKFKPDVDKLLRATLDAMTGIVFDDDARIVAIQCFKVYAIEDEGAWISVKASIDESAEQTMGAIA